jgi:hypothetical protein
MLAIGEDGQPKASGEWQITDEMRQAVDVLAAKLAKGIYWQHTQDIFPNDGGLAMTWYTNADVARDGRYKLFESLQHLAGNAPLLTRSGTYLNKFGNAFGFVVFGSTTPGLLEKTIHLAVASPRADGVEPFRILQSPTLPLGELRTTGEGSAE